MKNISFKLSFPLVAMLVVAQLSFASDNQMDPAFVGKQAKAIVTSHHSRECAVATQDYNGLVNSRKLNAGESLEMDLGTIPASPQKLLLHVTCYKNSDGNVVYPKVQFDVEGLRHYAEHPDNSGAYWLSPAK